MDLRAFWKNSRSTIVSGVIALAVIVGLFVVFNTLPAPKSQTSDEPQQEEPQQEEEQAKQEEEKKTDEQKEEKAETPGRYTVRAGESLWDISKKVYGTGYKWTLISRQNHLKDPNNIHSGNVLVIPKGSVAGTSTARSYKVVRGDTLWSIADHFYGSGFSWTKIRDANASSIKQLPNGRPLITVGQVLRIP